MVNLELVNHEVTAADSEFSAVFNVNDLNHPIIDDQ
jgi:hypothetical protein